MDQTGKHNRTRPLCVAVVLALVFTGILACVPAAQSKPSQAMQEDVAGDTSGQDQDAGVTVTGEPVSTGNPDVTEEPAGTLEPSAAPNAGISPKPSVKPTKTPVRLKPVSKVGLARYSTHSVKITWKKHIKAKFYRVYYYKENGDVHLAGITKGTQYIVRKLKNNTSYYFYVVAGKKKKVSGSDSSPSKKVHIKTRTYVHKTIFAGDSICQAVGYGQAFPQMTFAGKKKVIAYRGLNTVTFHTKRIFDGKTGLQKLAAEKPYRAYLMLGMNEIHYRKTSDMVAEYKGIIQALNQGSPGTDIVLCAVSPVTRGEMARNPGYSRIPSFNKELEKLAKKTGITYFDYTSFLKDSSGYLKAVYAEGDGYHWKASAYTEFGKVVDKFDKSLDQ